MVSPILTDAMLKGYLSIPAVYPFEILILKSKLDMTHGTLNEGFSQGRPLSVMNSKWGEITPLSKVITPVTHLQGH